MTEKEELRQKQENEILQEINGEEEVEYGLINDYAQCVVVHTRGRDSVLCDL